ncbi:hypothetical protein SynBIOSE41_03776 [Synechococcus sp. BIOS-E4-1]|nr:hypothetical protein SynBIOSE41_03776 [Synechococcus sp. BIOS-E4-1]
MHPPDGDLKTQRHGIYDLDPQRASQHLLNMGPSTCLCSPSRLNNGPANFLIPDRTALAIRSCSAIKAAQWPR